MMIDLRGSNRALVAFGLAGALLFGASCRKKDDGKAHDLEDLYSLRVVPTFDIHLAEAAVQSLRDQPKTWVRAELEYDGERFSDVSLRLKGHRSLRSIDDKPAMKLRLDKGEGKKKQRFLGVRRLTFNNMVEDPTMVREYLSYRLARAIDLPVPEAGFANLRINGEPYGLYLIVETPDKDFLERYYGDGSGQLFEGEYGCDLYAEDVPGFDQDSGKNKQRDALAGLAQAAARPANDLWGTSDAPMERDHIARFLAFSSYVGDFDGYHHSHNYRLYHRPDTQKWEVLSWGLDRAFVKRLPPYSSQGLLAKKCFADLACRIDYLRWLVKIDEAARKLDLAKGARILSAVLREHVRADKKRPYSDEEMKKALARLETFVNERSGDVEKSTSCLGKDAEVDADGDGAGCMDCDDQRADVHPGASEICDQVDNDCSGLVDDAPACSCPKIEVAGAQFFACDLPMTWPEAETHCVALGATLAHVDDREQAAALFAELRRISKERWWSGGQDRESEGHFVWPDGSAVPEELWLRGEPDNDACNQDCAAFKENAKGGLHDTHCAQARPFVCRIPSASEAQR